MGKYVVNGEVIDIQEDRPTALDLKKNAGSVATDWVMAKLPSGEILKLDDREVLPATNQARSGRISRVAGGVRSHYVHEIQLQIWMMTPDDAI